MKKPIFIIMSLCVFSLLNIIRCQQTVAEQCLIQAVANQNADRNLNRRQPVDPTDAIIIRVLESICSNIDGYTQCFRKVWNISQQEPADFYLGLLYNRSSMMASHQGFCSDIKDVESRVQCLHVSPPVQRCNDDFNRAVNQIALSRNRVPVNVLRKLACNVTVRRYSCELSVYRQCDARLGEIMADFLYGGLPVDCQVQTDVRSRYTELYGGSERMAISKRLVIISSTFAFISFLNTSE